MRVAYVSADPGVPVYGCKGASIHVQEVIRALLAKGLDVELLAARTGGPPPRGLDAVTVHPLPTPSGHGSSEQREIDAQRAGRLAGAVLDRIDRAGRFDLVYERYSLWGRSAMEWARATGVPGVLEVNAPLPDEHARHRVLHDRAAAEEVARHAIGAASVVVAVSTPVADWARAVGAPGRADPDKFHVVANGVDVERFRPGARRSVAGPTCTIGFLGTLKSWHGIDTLAESFALLAAADPSFRLLIIGDGPERGALEAKMAADGLTGSVEFAGAVDPSAVPSLLQRIDIAVAPYPASAGYFSPLKLYEYLAAGLPVVASNVGQVGDVITNGRNGLLCRAGDPVDLAAAIRVVRADPVLAASLGRAGRAMVEQHNTWHAVATRVLALAGADHEVAP